jgi:hypothetical protein
MANSMRDGLPECRAGECLPSVDEIRRRFEYVKGISSRTGGKTFHVVEAKDGYYAFVEVNGRFYSTASYPTIEELEDYIY